MLSRRSLLLAPLATPTQWPVEQYFRQILDGYLRNCRRTSTSWAVCDFPDGTILPGAVTPGGKTYDSVSRMLPALAAWAVRTGEHVDVLTAIYEHAFDPRHPDYWGAVTDRQNQRQVESSIVAWSLWAARDLILPKLSSASRRNINAWLDSCTQRPVRNNNWAWFTAVNQAVRLDLARKWPEFSGDEKWMVADLTAMDALAAPGRDGWYSDSPKEPVYDFYNFWVFASHFLYWNKILGSRYTDWSAKFTLRLRQFLETAPHVFGANGSHTLFGRSLIYRWAVLTPLVLAYEQGLWPHSAGLLKRIVRGNIEYFWKLGGYDEARGKLLETLSPQGSRAICESYIDNGHPYWGMQAFALWLIPKDRAFWTAAEEPLPVERKSFRLRIPGPGILLTGDKRSGEVRWMIAVNGHNEPAYRAKYTKFSYSTHAPWGTSFDNALMFRDPKSGEWVGQSGVEGGRLLDDGGYQRRWWVRVGDDRVNVTSTITAAARRHEITGPAGIEFIEGFDALPAAPAKPNVKFRGYDSVSVEQQSGTNIVHGSVWIVALRGKTKAGGTVLEVG